MSARPPATATAMFVGSGLLNMGQGEWEPPRRHRSPLIAFATPHQSHFPRPHDTPPQTYVWQTIPTHTYTHKYTHYHDQILNKTNFEVDGEMCSCTKWGIPPPAPSCRSGIGSFSTLSWPTCSSHGATNSRSHPRSVYVHVRGVGVRIRVGMGSGEMGMGGRDGVKDNGDGHGMGIVPPVIHPRPTLALTQPPRPHRSQVLAYTALQPLSSAILAAVIIAFVGTNNPKYKLQVRKSGQ